MCFHVFPCFSHHLFALSQASVMLTKMLALGKAWRSRRRAAGQSQRTPTVSLQLLEFLWFKKNFSSCDMFSACSVIVQVWKPSSLEYVPNCQKFRSFSWTSLMFHLAQLPSTAPSPPCISYLDVCTSDRRRWELPWMGQNWATSELDS